MFRFAETITKVCVLTALATLQLLDAPPIEASQSRRPNIVLILVDDMGYGDPQCYNAESKIPTHAIDSLAADGMMFTDAHASGPLCHISRYGLMTGGYPFRGNPGGWRKGPTIEQDQVTVGSLLQQEGYRTAMVGKWHLGFLENGYDKPLPGGPVDRGFDSFFGIRASTDIPPYFYIRDDRAVAAPSQRIEDNRSEGWSPIQGEFWRAGGIAPGLQLKDVLPRFTTEAVSVIEKHAAESAASRPPLFLYLAYPAPHTPWLPSPEFRGKSGASMYGDFAVMVDAHIGRVLNALDQAGMRDDTLVIFSSDNGPVWYQEDVERFQHDSVGGLRGMKSDAWEGGHRMPFIVRWPNVVKPGTKSRQLISFVDVLSTLADTVGASLPDAAARDSISFHSVLTGERAETDPVRAELVLHSGGGHRTIRADSWKYIDRLGSGGFSHPRRMTAEDGQPKVQLFDLSNDRGEKTNVAAQHPDKVRRLAARLREIEQARGHRFLK